MRYRDLRSPSVMTTLGLLLGITTIGLTSCGKTTQPINESKLQQTKLQRFTFREPHLGTHAGLVFYAPDNVVANRAATAAYERIGQLNAIFSTYLPESEIQRLCHNPKAAEGVPVSPELWEVLLAAQQLSRETEGAFDATVGPVARIWKRAIRRKTAPDPERIEQAMQSVGFTHVELNETNRTVRLTRPDMQLDLAGIAKGYIADEVLQLLREHGCDSALVDLGGDLAIGDPPPGKSGWRVGLSTATTEATQEMAGDASAAESILLHNCGLATSGDRFQHVEIDGKRYSHIVDARSGQATSESLTVTVISPNSMTADGLASAVSVLGSVAGWEHVRQTDGSEASILPRNADPDHPAKPLETEGFPNRE